MRGTTDYVLCYGGLDLQLYRYTEADYVNDLDECKSTNAYDFLLEGGVISWCSKKKSLVQLPTMKVEYVVASAATQEAIWLR